MRSSACEQFGMYTSYYAMIVFSEASAVVAVVGMPYAAKCGWTGVGWRERPVHSIV